MRQKKNNQISRHEKLTKQTTLQVNVICAMLKQSRTLVLERLDVIPSGTGRSSVPRLVRGNSSTKVVTVGSVRIEGTQLCKLGVRSLIDLKLGTWLTQ